MVMMLLMVGCGGSSSLVRSTVVTRSGLTVLAPTGPAILGAPLPRGSISLGADLGYRANTSGQLDPTTPGTAHANADLVGGAQVVVRAGYGELSLSGQFALPVWTPAHEQWVGPNATAGAGRLGFSSRIHFVEPRTWTIGLNLEAFVTVARFRLEASTVNTTIGGRLEPPSASTTTREASSVNLSASVGFFGGGRIGQKVWLLGGVMLQGSNAYPLYVERTYECSTTSGSCAPGGNPSPVSRSIGFGTPWLGAAVTLGRASLFGMVHANVIGNDEVRDRTPFGFTLGAHYAFAP